MGPVVGPSWVTVLTTWRPSWVVDALVLAVAVVYGLGVRRLGGRWPAGRSVLFAAALGGVVLTFDSGIAIWGRSAFAVHMVMHLMLIMVIPALLVAARPLEMVRDLFPQLHGRVIGSGPARVATYPATVFVVYALVVVLTHLTGFLEVAVGSPTLHLLEQVLYLGAGYLFFLTALGFDAGPRTPSYFARFVLMIATMGVDTLVGIVLMFGASTAFGSYIPDEVHLGGALMWVGGDALMMLLMVLLGRVWVADDSGRVDFGPWLEAARRRAVVEQIDDEPADDGVAERAGGPGTTGDIDDDDEALAAYNRMLTRLQRGEHR